MTTRDDSEGVAGIPYVTAVLGNDMRAAVASVTLALFLPVVLGCDLNSIPLGRSRMSAKVDGVYHTFSDIRPSVYVNLVASGRSDSGTVLTLILNDLSEGPHDWYELPALQFSPEQTACLHGGCAQPGWGGYLVERHSEGNRHLVGSFEFCVVDSTARDTTFVTEGRFDLYYGVSG